MKVYELSLKMYALEDIHAKFALWEIGKLIDKSFLENEELKELHKENKFKFYCFNSLFPIEKDKIYKSGNVYTVKIRTISEDIKRHFINRLPHQSTKSLKSLTIESREIPKRYIEKIYTVTPAVMKFEKGYWRNFTDINVFENRIKVNLIKKYNEFFNTKIDEDFDFFDRLTIDNQKPIATKYKNVDILGDKITLNISSSEIAQDMAYFVLGTGIAESNSRGFGYVNYRYI